MDQFGNRPRSPVCRRVQPFWMAEMESTDDLGPRKNLLENYKNFPDPCWAPPAAMVLLYMYQKDLDHVCEVATTGCFFQHNLGNNSENSLPHISRPQIVRRSHFCRLKKSYSTANG